MKTKRKEYILDTIRNEKKVKASDIVKKFNVTMETVRRDLEDLENQGLLRRVYGGAIEGKIYEPEPSYDSRMVTRLEEKQRIAEKACEFINPGETIFLDGGTTCLLIAKYLASTEMNLFVVTNSIPVAEALSTSETIDVVMLGGIISKGELVVNKLLSYDQFKIFNFQKLICGVASISKSQGITDFSYDASILKRELMKQKPETIFVCDHTKFSKMVRYSVAQYDEIDILITDSLTSKEDIDACKKAGIEVIVA